MKNIYLLIGLVIINLTACGPSPEELAFQTQKAATAIAASWTKTPTHSATPTFTSTLTPTITLTPTVTATSTPTNTLTPTVTSTSTPMITETPNYSIEIECPEPWKEMTLDDCRHHLLLKVFNIMYYERYRNSANSTHEYPEELENLPQWESGRIYSYEYYVCFYYPYSEFVIDPPEIVNTLGEFYPSLTYNELQVFLEINCNEILNGEN